MYRNKLTTLILAGLVLAGACAQAQEQSRNGRSAEVAAAQGLAILQSLAGNKSGDAGFASGAEATRATLGMPLKVFSVDLKSLGTFKSGDDAAALLRPAGAVFYPVLVDGAVRSSVRIENSGGGWEPARVGNSGLAAAVTRGRAALSRAEDPDTVLVQVLALNLLFVAQKSGAGWQLTPVVDDASVELKVGKVESAESVFVRLAPVAARLNGDPT